MKVSIIVPMYNEEKIIKKFQKDIKFLQEKAEIIFVDGGSTDKTLERMHPAFTVVHSQKGRAVQMNFGARKASGDVLLFLHCDSEPPKDTIEQLEEGIQKYRAGCFGIAFYSPNIWMKCCQIISNHRIKDRKVMFGDQGIFVERSLFFELGGFEEIPIMEDYQFSLLLKEKGIKIGLLKSRIYTSDRRFKVGGRLSVMWKMNRLRAMYRRGVEPQLLAQLYRDIR